MRGTRYPTAEGHPPLPPFKGGKSESEGGDVTPSKGGKSEAKGGDVIPSKGGRAILS